MRIGTLLIALFWGGFAQAAPIEGYWLGPVDPDGNRSTVQIYPCANKFCGRVSSVTQASSNHLVGQVILIDLTQQSDAAYTDGVIRFDHLSWRFSGSIQMTSANAATLRGCWAGVVCRNVPFTRTSG